MSDDNGAIRNQKEVEFYSACVDAWVNTRMEGDKSVLTLSAGGVGLLVTLISTVGIRDIWGLILYVLGALCFLLSIISVLFVFRLNAEYLQKLVGDDHDCGADKDEVLLKLLDKIVSLSFVGGVLFSFVIGLTIAVNSCNFKTVGGKMAQEHSKRAIVVGDSLSDLRKLDPSTKINESISGLGAMKPKPADNQVKQPKGDSSSSTSSGESKNKK